jgi:hypothetical protein
MDRWMNEYQSSRASEVTGRAEVNRGEEETTLS